MQQYAQVCAPARGEVSAQYARAYVHAREFPNSTRGCALVREGIARLKNNQLESKVPMPKSERTRIDYMPGNAALDALALAGEIFPDTRAQALLDMLVITAVSALTHERLHKRWEPPPLWGNNRDKWKLPEELRPGTVGRETHR